MSFDLVLSAILWTTFTTIVAQAIAIGLMWWLGLPPRKLTHEIEEVQNPAVGAGFFIVALTAAIFVGLMATDGFTEDPPFVESLLWMAGGVLLALAYTSILFIIAHRVMGRENDENVYQYMQRELIDEQNASLAFFLGSLAITPFIAVVFQLI
jgi:hypothetical protein